MASGHSHHKCRGNMAGIKYAYWTTTKNPIQIQKKIITPDYQTGREDF